ncbi:hypothetical protein LIER_18153 [Lithospermum erythrorhizon]|uniref:Uncharacterized protein n=1 Tax=Lithospermum erythrorhizon TaxID=34254 RepID=A0AAV3QFD8_LITER
MGLKFMASSSQRFDMRVGLMTTVSDFPAYIMLSGWSTKGYLACPSCHYETDGQHLPHSNKLCYQHHRRFLEPFHPWRHNKKNFNGKSEERNEHVPLKEIDIENLLSK